MVCLIPAQHIEPLLVDHYENGLVTVEPIHQPYTPNNRAEIESELVRYVINRESYSPSSYHEQYALINLLSDDRVARDYIAEQSVSNRLSFISRFGNKVDRSVHIENVFFLDSVNATTPTQGGHHNLAQINFVVIDRNRATGEDVRVPLTVLISWEYRGVSNNPEDRWRDWDGFTVTDYRVEQRNV